MKKITSLLMAVLMLCALCVPVFAEDAKEVEPRKNSGGNYEINLTSAGNYIIKKDCEVFKLSIKYCTLTIAEGVKVKVTGSFDNNKNVLNIESGAVLEYCGDNFTNNGTMNVYGTVNVDSTTFDNSGIMNVYGTFNYRENGTIANTGNFNKYCTGTFNGKYKNLGSGIMNTGVHDWKNGECTLCHTECTHENWSGGVCNNCKIVCTHEHWTGGVCDTCHYACPHGNWTEGVCDTCHKKCTHESWTGNECDTCHYACQHAEGTTVICNCCGGVLSTTAAGSTLSEGSLTIVCTVAGVAVGFLVAMFIFKKKKPALASGTENTELSE